VPTFSIAQADQPETESEIFHPTVEQPLHETSEFANVVEEAYVPPAEPFIEQEQAAHYNAWDASRSVYLILFSFTY
jgi:hypothetical protein